jgi:hypothetical protein
MYVKRTVLKQRLVGLKLQLSGDSQTHVLQPELIHGLTDKVISDIVVKSEILFTPDDVMKNCQIWSYETGVAICNIITEIYGDKKCTILMKTLQLILNKNIYFKLRSRIKEYEILIESY